MTYVRQAGTQYGRVPTWLLMEAVSDRAIRLYALMAAKYASDGTCYPRRKLLAEELGCHVRTVDNAMEELVTIGAVTKTTRWTPQGDRSSNLYELAFDHPKQRVADPETMGGDHEVAVATPHRTRPREPDPENQTQNEPAAAAAAAEDDGYHPEHRSVLRHFESRTGTTVTPRISEQINGRIERHGADLVKAAIDEAAESNARSFRYVMSILDRCERDGSMPGSKRGTPLNDVSAMGLDLEERRRRYGAYSRRRS